MKKHKRNHTNIISNEIHTIVFIYKTAEHRYIDYMTSMDIRYDYSDKDKNIININFSDTVDIIEDFMDIAMVIVDLQDLSGNAIKRKSFNVDTISYGQNFEKDQQDESSIINLVFKIKSGDVSTGDLIPIENYIRDYKINGIIDDTDE